MAMEGPRISFVTWPDGKVSGESLTVGGERIARERHILSYLPSDWFGPVTSYVLDGLWSGMKTKGFKSHTVEIGEDGNPLLVDDD